MSAVFTSRKYNTRLHLPRPLPPEGLFYISHTRALYLAKSNVSLSLSFSLSEGGFVREGARSGGFHAPTRPGKLRTVSLFAPPRTVPLVATDRTDSPKTIVCCIAPSIRIPRGSHQDEDKASAECAVSPPRETRLRSRTINRDFPDRRSIDPLLEEASRTSLYFESREAGNAGADLAAQLNSPGEFSHAVIAKHRPLAQKRPHPETTRSASYLASNRSVFSC